MSELKFLSSRPKKLVAIVVFLLDRLSILLGHQTSCSQFNTEVKKHRAKKVLGWVANWEIMVLLA